MNRLLQYFSIYFLGMILSLSSGFSVTAKAQESKTVDRIVAVVNDDIILLSDLDRSVKPYLDRVRQSGYTIDQQREMLFKVRENVLNQLIDQKLTDKEIERYQIKVSEKQIDNAIEHMKEVRFLTDEDLRAALARDGVTMEEYRKLMKEQILRTMLINQEVKSKIVITQEDIRDRYEKDKDKYHKDIVFHLRNIVMKVPSPGSEEQRLMIENRMEAILARLNAGEVFSNLANIYSDSPSAKDGGNLGSFKLEALSPQIREAIKDLKAGEFTPVLHTDQGYQIFFVSEIVETQGKSLEEASPEIGTQLYNEIVDKKFAEWLEDLRKRSTIKIIK
ncbi:MAG: SurA N-terminal domain-containing protein [Pseudomonadota bacterium]